jgi:hypothetical protein
MERERCGAFALTAFVAMVCCQSCARSEDKVVLVDGTAVRGTVTEQTEESVTIRTRRGTSITLGLDRVRSITTAAGERVVNTKPARAASAPADRKARPSTRRAASAADVAAWWRMEGEGAIAGTLRSEKGGPKAAGKARDAGALAYSSDVAARHIYDPLTGKSYANTSSVQFPKEKGRSARVETTISVPRGKSFTVEAYVKLDHDPKRHCFAVAAGDTKMGARFLPRWNQTYWAAFSSATKEEEWSTGHYVTISRIHPKTFGWRHLALVYDAEAGTLTCWLEHYQEARRKVERPIDWNGKLFAGGSEEGGGFPGLVDEVRVTLAALNPGQFLRARDDELSGVSFDSPATVFPEDAGCLDVKRNFGAIGDGRHDDTKALNKALEVAPRGQFIFLPNGTYLVSDMVSWRHFRILYGESRERTVVRLKDRCAGYASGRPKPVVRCKYSNNESIMNFIVNMTVDTGRGNPDAVGVMYNAHNQGAIENVTIRSGDGKGRIGLDLSETEFGPALVKNVTVEGFDVGIKTPGNCSHATMEYVTLRSQRVVGLENHLPVSIRKLVSVNSVPAVRNGKGWMAHLVLIDSELTGGSPEQCAIENNGNAYLRNIKTSGYKAALMEKANVVPGSAIDERVTGPIHTLFTSRKTHLKLPIEDPPEIFTEPPSRWVAADDSADDDTKAIQDAIDSGARTVYLRYGGRYEISDTIHVRGNVRRIVGMKAGVRGDPKRFGMEKPLFRFDGRGRHPVTVEHLKASTHPKPCCAYELATPQTLYFRYSSGFMRNTPAAKGKLFIDEQMGYVEFNHPQRVWIRQLDTETHGKRPSPPTYLVNRGGQVWVLGMKTESIAVHCVTLGGGRTEILGGFFRDHRGSSGVPYFKTVDSSLTATYLQYAWAPGKARALQAIETRGGVTKELSLKANNLVMGLYSAALPERKR